MELHHFGPHESQLLGVHHAPAKSPRACGIALCYPIGQEYIRAHRAFRQLATRLSRAGFYTLRFDYFASGDSAGASDEATVDRWLSDVSDAIELLKRRDGVRRVALVGLRLGASLAALAAMERRDTAGVVLWEPVVDGSAYVRELMNDQAALSDRRRQLEGERFASQARGSSEREILGFPVTDRLLEALERIDLLAAARPPAREILLVERARTEAARELADRFSSRGADTEHRAIASPRIWSAVDRAHALVPRETLECIVNWCSEKLA